MFGLRRGRLLSGEDAVLWRNGFFFGLDWKGLCAPVALRDMFGMGSSVRSRMEMVRGEKRRRLSRLQSRVYSMRKWQRLD